MSYDLFSESESIPLGATAEEIEIGLHLRRSTASARCSELRHHGYVEYACDGVGNPVKRNTSSGYPAYVLVSTDLGKTTIKLGLAIIIGNNRDPTESKHGGVETSKNAFATSDFSIARQQILSFIDSRS